MNLRPVYRMYVDEVGNTSTTHLEHPENRYFSLTGIVVELKHESAIATDMKALKLKYFGSDAIVLHRNDIERANTVFRPLLNFEVRQSFSQELLELLRRWNYVVITSCLDKVSLAQRKALSQMPFHQCATAPIEPYIMFLEDSNSYGDLMLESRNKTEDIALDLEFARFWRSSIKTKRLDRVLTSRHLKIRHKSDNQAGLQLADLLAFPSQQVVLRDYIPTLSLSDMTTSIITVLETRYYQRGEILYGKRLIK